MDTYFAQLDTGRALFWGKLPLKGAESCVFLPRLESERAFFWNSLPDGKHSLALFSLILSQEARSFGATHLKEIIFCTLLAYLGSEVVCVCGKIPEKLCASDHKDPYFYRFLAYLDLEVTHICGIIPINFVASAGKSRQHTSSFNTYLAHHDSEKIPSCGSTPSIFHQQDKMDADTGKKGMRATISLIQNLAHNYLEMARIEGNVAIEPGSSNEGEIGVSQQGKAIRRSLDIILGSLPLRNA